MFLMVFILLLFTSSIIVCGGEDQNQQTSRSPKVSVKSLAQMFGDTIQNFQQSNIGTGQPIEEDEIKKIEKNEDREISKPYIEIIEKDSKNLMEKQLENSHESSRTKVPRNKIRRKMNELRNKFDQKIKATRDAFEDILNRVARQGDDKIKDIEDNYAKVIDLLKNMAWQQTENNNYMFGMMQALEAEIDLLKELSSQQQEYCEDRFQRIGHNIELLFKNDTAFGVQLESIRSRTQILQESISDLSDLDIRVSGLEDTIDQRLQELLLPTKSRKLSLFKRKSTKSQKKTDE
jgi:hypothetical protein